MNVDNDTLTFAACLEQLDKAYRDIIRTCEYMGLEQCRAFFSAQYETQELVLSLMEESGKMDKRVRAALKPSDN